MGEVKTGRESGRATVVELEDMLLIGTRTEKAEKGKNHGQRMVRDEDGVKY